MSYTTELKRFVTSQYIYSGVRVALAIVVPSVLLAYFGVLKEFFLFPLATSFVAFSDQPGPFTRRRNALIIAALSFTLTALIASLLKDFLVLKYIELIVLGMFLTMLGVYGQRFGAIGSISLVILAIFIDGDFAHGDLLQILKNILIYGLGSFFYVLIFLVVSKIQPYKLAGQMIGENYLLLAEYLKIKAHFYQKNPDFDGLFKQLIASQIKIKNLQEETRDTVFRTRTLVKESTTTSRILLLMFLNSIDLHEKLLTSENDYRKIQEKFGNSEVLAAMHEYLTKMSNEISAIGLALQSNTKVNPTVDLDLELEEMYKVYFEYRNRNLDAHNLEDFLLLRQILHRITEVTSDLKSILLVDGQNPGLVSPAAGDLDLKKFLNKEQDFSLRALKSNLSIKSSIFQHAIKVTLSILIGYSISLLSILGVGHSYWILITILAILRPSFSLTKSRNLQRLYGTVAGAISAYLILTYINNGTALLIFLFLSIMLCFSFLKDKYGWAVLFMTIYIFITFNFLKPGNINIIFKDRVVDTLIAIAITFLVSYFVFPVWEYTQNLNLMKKVAASNKAYFEIVIDELSTTKMSGVQTYKLARKEAMINLANLSANFQRMISDPKRKRKRSEMVYQYVSTSHLMVSYIASLAQYAEQNLDLSEIDFQNWKKRICNELDLVEYYLKKTPDDDKNELKKEIIPTDMVEDLLEKRKAEIEEDHFYDRRDISKTSRLTVLKNVHDILELIYDVAREQRKFLKSYFLDQEKKENQPVEIRLTNPQS